MCSLYPFIVKTIYVLRLIIDTMRILLNFQMKMEEWRSIIPIACQLSAVESGSCTINIFVNCTENSECLSN